MEKNSQRYKKFIFQAMITALLFSLWAGFALLVVNPFFYKSLPGYTIGRICIWEYVALAVSAWIAYGITQRWGSVEVDTANRPHTIVMHANYGIFFLVYLAIAIVTGIWQFWLFSQQF